MDFIDLAEQASPSNIARFLDQILGDDNTAADEAASMAAAGGASSSYYGDSTSQPSGLQQQQQEQRPIMSKTAEAELYLLATNFLLYVAMVLITVLVAKIYFPETLDRSSSSAPNSPTASASAARSYSYRMARRGPSDGNKAEGYNSDADDEYYDDNFEDDDDNHEHDELYDDEDVLDSDEDDETNGLRSRGGKSFGGGAGNGRGAKGIKNLLEFEQSSLSKLQVIRRLIFCSLMLNVTFVIWGILQERMLTRRYPRYTGEYFTYSYALVFTNRFWTLIMSGLLMLRLKPNLSRTTVIYEYSFPSISNMLSSWCQYEALRYVSFPATTLFKSFKLAPVMAMGKILGNKSYPQYDYLVALLIGTGCCMFMSSTDDLRFGYDYLGEQVSQVWTGVMLLSLYLVFDSFTSQFQSRMFQRHRDLSMVELMFVTSAFSTVLSFVTLLHTNELTPAVEFMMNHSEIHLHFFLFSICSTIGQLFIFYTIRNFGAVVFTLIMTTRILISIAVSCVLYGHQVSATGFFGLSLVVAAVIYRIRRKAQGQQLLTWKGMEDDAKAVELVQEWHEHVDM